MKYLFLNLGFLVFSNFLDAQIPNLNGQNRLDLVSWNIEWFGDASNGPSNDVTQLNNVTKIINGLDVDIMGLCEVSNSNYWQLLKNNLPNYHGVISTWDQPQKTALFFKKSQFKLVYQKHVLSNYEYEFASGRLPLEVCLEVIDKSLKIDTIYFWVIHLKANTGSTSAKIESYNRRNSASVLLKSHVLNTCKKWPGFVIGDWNDDFDKSIVTGYKSPFESWIEDTANAFVPTYKLSLAGKKSTVSYSEMIDHIACSANAKNNCVVDSTMAIYADNWVTSYGSSTSDHYPVYTRFDFTRNNNQTNSIDVNLELSSTGISWNGEHWILNGVFLEMQEATVFSSDGKLLFNGLIGTYKPTNQKVVCVVLQSDQFHDLKRNWVYIP